MKRRLNKKVDFTQKLITFVLFAYYNITTLSLIPSSSSPLDLQNNSPCVYYRSLCAWAGISRRGSGIPRAKWNRNKNVFFEACVQICPECESKRSDHSWFSIDWLIERRCRRNTVSLSSGCSSTGSSPRETSLPPSAATGWAAHVTRILLRIIPFHRYRQQSTNVILTDQ